MNERMEGKIDRRIARWRMYRFMEGRTDIRIYAGIDTLCRQIYWATPLMNRFDYFCNFHEYKKAYIEILGNCVLLIV